MATNILIVDDSVSELRVLVHMLQKAGYELTVAQTGSEGLQRALIVQPDIILLDVRMPYMDGFAVCRHLKAQAQTQHIPVIFLSAANDADSRLEGLRWGACDYIVKPPVEEDVLLRLSIHLARTEEAASSEQTHAAAVHVQWRDGCSDILAVPSSVACACDMVMRNPEFDWSQDVLAEKVCLPRKRLNEEFKQVFGVTMMVWVRNHRIRQAAHWLRYSGLNVSVIAGNLGFDSSAHFATVFRAQFGVSPVQYRAASAGQPIGDYDK